MNVFAESDYRAVLKKAVAERKRVDSRFTFQRLAEAMRVQKSYLSRVLGGTAELSADQLFLACEHLELGESQRSYLELLLEHARCGLDSRRRALAERIRATQERHRETKEHLSARELALGPRDIETYYLDPIHQIVHLCLTVDRFRADPGVLAGALRLPLERVLSIVNKLEQLGIVGRARGELRVLVDSVHLPRESPVFQAWRSQLRILALQRLQSAPNPRDYSYSVVFSADAAVQEALRSQFLEFLKNAEKSVRKAPPKGAFQMSFDLFQWA